MAMEHARPRRRVPVWVWIVIGALVVAGAAVVALLLVNRGGAVEPEAAVVTLPVPTATVEPIERDAGSAFYESLPSTVLDFALSSSEDDSDMMAIGALEAYRLTYTTGSDEVVLQAGQWASSEDAEAARLGLTDLVPDVDLAAATDPASEPATQTPAADDASAGADTSAGAGASTGDEAADAEGAATDGVEPVGTQSGAVEADGSAVGTYVLVSHGDGTGTIVWSNTTAVFYAEGPLVSLQHLYAGFPL